MAKITIWPDIYKEQGHWLPCVTLAKTLKDLGHTVRFMGIEDCASIVAPYHGDFDTIMKKVYPLGYSFENKLEPVDQRWKPHHLLPLMRGEADIPFTSTNKPDLLIGGYFTGLESLLLRYKYGIKIALITTYLRHPQDDPALFAKAKLIHMPQAVARKLMDGVLPPADRGMSIEKFVAPLQDVKEMIPCPKAFDYTDPDWVHKAQVTYVEPMIVRSSLTADPITLPDPITIPNGKTLLYATSGSMVQDYESRARVFFRNLISMMQTQNMDSYYLVIGAGARVGAQLRAEYGLVPGGTSILPTNVLIRDWVSQIDVLGNPAAAAFMHGGLATIKESIWEKVPIIIVPHGKDQMDNARRIARAGVGLVAQVGELGPEQLRALLTTATTSTWIKQNLVKFEALLHAEDDKAPGARLSVGVINGVLSS
jgi:UDP:flavonoid glycosyltransferase YjiC (YdhE family)